MAGLLNMGGMGGLLGGQQPAMPRVPWRQNQAVTGFALGMLGAPNIHEGFRQAAPMAVAGMGGNNTMQQIMLAQQEKSDAIARQKAAWNAGMKWKSGVALTPEDQDALAGSPDIAARFMPDTPQPTDDIREFQYGQGNPAFNDWMLSQKKAGATTVDARQMGTIPPGYKANYDANGNIISMEPIPGGPEDRTIPDANKREKQIEQADIVVNDIDRSLAAIEKAPGWTTGLGGDIMRGIPGSSASNVESLIDSVKANIGFEQLNQMRAASPTGAALGSVQVVELQFLQSVLGSLAQSQSADQLSYNLKRLKNVYLDIIHGEGNGPAREVLDMSKGPAPGTVEDGFRFKGGDPGDPDNWEKQ